MRRFLVPLRWVLASALVLAMTPWSLALIMVGRGDEPVKDHNWPEGSLAAANLKSRAGWWEGPPFGGGEWHFLYRGETAGLQEMVDQFAKINSPHLKIVLHEGPGKSPFLTDPNDPKKSEPIDWELTLWDAQSFNHLNNNPQSTFLADSPSFRHELAGPRLDVYLSDKRTDWKKIHLPHEIDVTDERATSHGYAADDGNIIRGEVFDMATSKPVADAELIVQKQGTPQAGKTVWDGVASAKANEQRKFEMKKVPAGSYRLIARAPGHARRVIEYLGLEKNVFKNYIITIAPQAQVSGVVTDPAGKGLANVNVRAQGVIGVDGRGYTLADSPQATTDAAGHFELNGLPAGHTLLFAYADRLHQADSLKLYDVPSQEVKLVMGATGTVTGRVILPERVGKQEIYVQISPEGGDRVGTWGGSMKAKEDGSFEFDNVPPGEYRILPGLSFSPAGNKPLWTPVSVRAGQTSKVDVKVQ